MNMNLFLSQTWKKRKMNTYLQLGLQGVPESEEQR